MDFTLTPAQVLLRDTTREFGTAKVGPLMLAAEREQRFPREVFTLLGEMGMLCMSFPEELGGSAADRTTECVVVEELARVSSSAAGAMMVHSGVATSAIFAHGSSELKERLLPAATRGEKIAAFALTESDAGSDAAAIRTSARRDGHSYVLNGAKAFITNGGIADFVTVAAVTDPHASRGRGISLFVVERGTPGFLVGGEYAKLGHRAADTVELIFEDCTIPAANLIGAENRGFPYLAESLISGRILHAARSLAVGEAAFEMALRYANEREAFGQPIGGFQAVGFKLSRMAAELECVRWAVYHAAWKLDTGRPCVREAAIAKLVASEVAERTAGEALHIHGGFGYMEEAGIERLWRDAKLFRITEGTSEIQQLIIARDLGLPV